MKIAGGQKHFTKKDGYISKELGLTKIYTNHSVRATAITALSDAGVEARHIATISKHRNLASIANYNKEACEAQKRAFSEILQNDDGLAHDTDSTSTTTKR